MRKYFKLPEGIPADPEQLRFWANEAMDVAEGIDDLRQARTAERQGA